MNIDHTSLYERLKQIDREIDHIEIMVDQLVVIWFLSFAALAGALVLWLVGSGIL